MRALSWLNDYRGRHPVRAVALATIGAVLTVAAVLLFTPILDRPLATGGQAAASYEEAMARARRSHGHRRARDQPGLPLARRLTRAAHRALSRPAARIHQLPAAVRHHRPGVRGRGYSVVVPRLPGHGHRDRLTKALSDVRPDDLVHTADLAVDIAAGLGDEVTVVGLSGGGTLAAWLATERNDVNRAVLIAPW